MRRAAAGADAPTYMYPISRRSTSSASVAHMNGELRAGKRMPEGKSRSKMEFWVMALSARARRVQKAVCQETGLWVGGCCGWELVLVEAVLKVRLTERWG